MNNILNKISEREKVKQVLNSIEADSFNSTDIDLIFIKLREYSKSESSFKEIAHFCAHNETRDKGYTFSHMDGFFNTMLFHLNHTFEGGTLLNLDDPIPKYFIKTIQNNVRLSEENFIEKYGCSKESFINRFKKNFVQDKGTNTYSLKGSLRGSTKKIVEDMSCRIISRPLFTQEQIIQDFIETIKSNQFSINEELIKINQGRIILSILLLMNGTDYPINKSILAKSYMNLAEKNGKYVLELISYIPSQYKDKSIYFAFPVISTSLDVEQYCSQKILETGINEGNRDKLTIKNGKLDFSS